MRGGGGRGLAALPHLLARSPSAPATTQDSGEGREPGTGRLGALPRPPSSAAWPRAAGRPRGNSPNKVAAAAPAAAAEASAAGWPAPTPAPGMSSPSKPACSPASSREKPPPLPGLPHAWPKRGAEAPGQLLWQLPSAGPSEGRRSLRGEGWEPLAALLGAAVAASALRAGSRKS